MKEGEGMMAELKDEVAKRKVKKMGERIEKMSGKRIPDDKTGTQLEADEVSGENDEMCPHCGKKI